MKKVFLVTILFVCTLVSISCDKDDEGLTQAEIEAQQEIEEAEKEAQQEAEEEAKAEAINAVLTFPDRVYDFGTITAGNLVTRVFTFKNTGNVPVTIQSLEADCGCTVPSYPKEAIAAGAEGEVVVEFDTSNKSGEQYKKVTLKLDTIEGEKILVIKGTVTL